MRTHGFLPSHLMFALTLFSFIGLIFSACSDETCGVCPDGDVVNCQPSGNNGDSTDGDDTTPWTPPVLDGDADTNDNVIVGTSCSDGPCVGVASELSFGAVYLWQSKTQSLHVYNNGEGLLILREIALSDATSDDFSILSPQLEPGESLLVDEAGVEIQIDYTRSDVEGDSGTLIITSNDVLTPNTRVALTNDYKGVVTLGVSPEQLDFGTESLGEESESMFITITATGSADSNRILEISNIYMDKGSASAFVFHPEPLEDEADTDCRLPLVLPGGEQRRCRVAFRPSSIAGVNEDEFELTDTLVVVAKDRGNEDQQENVALQGTGTAQRCTTDEQCNDGNFCTDDDHCDDNGYCVATEGSRDCSGVVTEAACQIGVCNEDLDRCEIEFKQDGLTVCNDDPTDYQVCYQGDCIRPDLQLSEVFYDASGDDNEKEWVEIYNNSPVQLNLSHYKIAGGADSGTGGYLFTYNGFLSGKIPPGGCYVIGGPLKTDGNGNPDYDIELNFEDDIQNGGSNSGNGVGLFNILRDGNISNTSVPVDAVVYGSNNDDDLLCPNGQACPGAHVGDSGSDASIEKGNDGQWSENNAPSPGVCHIR